MTARLRSVALRLAEERRTNEWYRNHVPDVVAAVAESRLAKTFSTDGSDAASEAFDAQMRRYLDDPFRGATVRYKLGPNQTSIDLEADAARAALAAAGLDADAVDLILVASWLPASYVAPGNAVYLAQRLGTRAVAINVETACSSGLACLALADAMVRAGHHRRALVVLSNTVSRQADDRNSLSWISSDLACAAVVEAGEGPGAFLGVAMENTAETAGVFVHAIRGDAVRMELGPTGSHALRSQGPALMRRLCDEALRRAGVGIDAIRYVGCSTPLAWFAALGREALAVDEDAVIDLFPHVGNAGLPFPLLHLHAATAAGRLRPGDLALLYTVGSTSSAAAMVVRVDDWALGGDALPLGAGR